MNEVRTPGPEANIGGVQVSLQSVYLKDSSYESPNGPRLPNNQGWEPKFQLNMNTSAEELANAAVSLEGELGPFAFRDLPLNVNRLRRDRRLVDGQLWLRFQGRGTLLAPTGTATRPGCVSIR